MYVIFHLRYLCCDGLTTKDLVDETITDYASNISSSLLPLLPPPVERQSHPITTTTPDDQTHMHTDDHRLFTQSEMDDDD